MSGNNLLLDSNIVLYLLKGEQTLVPLLEEKQLYVSFITQLETLGYKGITKEEQAKITNFLNECVIVDINAVIKNFTIVLRQKYGLKLPDSIIMATSLYLNIPLITSDIEFKKIEEIDLLFYEKI
jgi:predicted nucleic acid-binding protein